MTGIYIHIPFCVRKCFYCDFYSDTDFSSQEKFVESLLKEIRLQKKLYPDYDKIDTIFLGGGTPSVLPIHHLKIIFDTINDHFEISSETEITIECNPGTDVISKFEDYLKIGINRISLGVQSFNDNELKFLQRIHSSQKAIDTFNGARSAGFENISIDLIFSIPDQTLETLNQSIESAISLNPDNISYYSLIYEPETPLYADYESGKVKKVRDEADAANYELIIKSFQEAGYIQYEVSNFSKPGKQCRHNLIYWHGNEYFGFGPSAHGYLQNQRYWNIRNTGKYNQLLAENRFPVEGSESLSLKNRFEEVVYLGLRADGININEISKVFSNDFKQKALTFLELYQNEGFFIMSGEHISLSPKGYLFCDEICLKFLSYLDDLSFL